MGRRGKRPKEEFCADCKQNVPDIVGHAASQRHANAVKIADARAGGYRPISFPSPQDADRAYLFLRRLKYSVVHCENSQDIWFSEMHFANAKALLATLHLEIEDSREAIFQAYLRRLQEAYLHSEGVAELSEDTAHAIVRGQLRRLTAGQDD